MCHLPMKLSDTFDQNPPSTFDKILEKPIPMKNFESKGQGHSKNLKPMPYGTKKYASQKKLEQGFP